MRSVMTIFGFKNRLSVSSKLPGSALNQCIAIVLSIGLGVAGSTYGKVCQITNAFGGNFFVMLSLAPDNSTESLTLLTGNFRFYAEVRQKALAGVAAKTTSLGFQLAAIRGQSTDLLDADQIEVIFPLISNTASAQFLVRLNRDIANSFNKNTVLVFPIKQAREIATNKGFSDQESPMKRLVGLVSAIGLITKLGLGRRTWS